MDFSQIKNYTDFREKTGMDTNTAFNFLKNELKKRGYVLDE